MGVACTTCGGDWKCMQIFFLGKGSLGVDGRIISIGISNR